MSESLVIRQGTHAQQPVHWLVCRRQNGRSSPPAPWPRPMPRRELQERAGGRPVVTLVPGSDLIFRRVSLPGKYSRQVRRPALSAGGADRLRRGRAAPGGAGPSGSGRGSDGGRRGEDADPGSTGCSRRGSKTRSCCRTCWRCRWPTMAGPPCNWVRSGWFARDPVPA